MFSSCTKDSGEGKIDPEAEGTGSLVLNINIAGGVGTRADETSTGLAKESRISELRIILYNSAGIAECIDSYYIYDNGDGTWDINGELENTGKLSIEGPDKTIKATFTQIKKQDYQLLVIANPVGLQKATLDPSDYYNNVYNLSLKKGHSVELFNAPYDLTAVAYGSIFTSYDPSSTYKYYYYETVLKCLTGISVYDPTYSSNRLENNISYQLNIMMLNADGLVQVAAADIAGSIEAANDKAAKVDIERAAAKVSVFNELGVLANGATISGDVNWAADIMSYHSYMLRQHAPIAGGGAESASTPRSQRYAKDTNYAGVSYERPGGSPTSDLVARNFYNIQTVLNNTSIQENSLFYRTANPSGTYNSPAHEWTYWDYLSENTMEAAEQHEDVTTRVLVRFNYVPGESQVIPITDGGSRSIAAGANYYSYKNKVVFRYADIQTIVSDGTQQGIADRLDGVQAVVTGLGQTDADEINGLLEELKTVLYDIYANTMLKTAFNLGFASPSSRKGASTNGFNFHYGGMNYYRVLIRHFDDSIEPSPMAYGRYGVVRNNVYKIVLTDVSGPGAGMIPAPKGPDDKIDPLKSKIKVADWTTTTLNYDF